MLTVDNEKLCYKLVIFITVVKNDCVFCDRRVLHDRKENEETSDSGPEYKSVDGVDRLRAPN